MDPPDITLCLRSTIDTSVFPYLLHSIHLFGHLPSLWSIPWPSLRRSAGAQEGVTPVAKNPLGRNHFNFPKTGRIRILFVSETLDEDSIYTQAGRSSLTLLTLGKFSSTPHHNRFLDGTHYQNVVFSFRIRANCYVNFSPLCIFIFCWMVGSTGGRSSEIWIIQN